jgi:hypothetical protein
MWKLVFNAIDVIFKFESLKRKNPCYVQKNNAPSKIFNFFFFWNKQKLQLIWTYENMVKF